jgi:hypothetical protein
LEIETEGRTYEAEGDTVDECVAAIAVRLERQAEEAKLHDWNAQMRALMGALSPAARGA